MHRNNSARRTEKMDVERERCVTRRGLSDGFQVSRGLLCGHNGFLYLLFDILTEI